MTLSTSGLGWFWRFLLGAIVVLTSGCGLFLPKPRAVDVNLFGEVRAWSPVPFDTQPASTLQQHSYTEEGRDFDPDVSGDGRWIVLASTRHSPLPNLYIKGIDGQTVTQLTSDPASEIQPKFSPDGKQVAYASNRTGNWDIWIVDRDGSNPTQVTSAMTHELHPSWSPDGAQIVYCKLGARSGQWELWTLELAKPGNKKFIGYGLFPEWCPNPKYNKIAYQRARARGSHWFSIWTLDLVDGEARYPTEIAAAYDTALIAPAWSPDGEYIAYATVGQSGEDQAAPLLQTGDDIWVTDIHGRERFQLTDGKASNYMPVWSPDGRLFFCSNRSGHENVWSLRPLKGVLAAGQPTTRPRQLGAAVSGSRMPE